MLIIPCRISHVQETTQQLPSPNRVSLGHGRAPQRFVVSCEENYMFSIPRYGSVLGWGVYISDNLWNPPSRKTPPEDERLMMHGGPFCILIQVGLLMDCCHPAIRQIVKILRLGIELTMVTAIRTTGHTRG